MAHKVQLTADGLTLNAEIAADTVTIAGADAPFAIAQDADGTMVVTTSAGSVRGIAARDGDTVWVGIDGRVFAFQADTTGGRARAASSGDESLAPPMSATVVRVHVKAGDVVHAGDLLVVLEAMKMELPIHAPRDARVKAVNCHEGELVQPGTQLVDLSSAE